MRVPSYVTEVIIPSTRATSLLKSPESPNRLLGDGCSGIRGDTEAELRQAPHTVAGEAVGRQAIAVVRPEIMARPTIPQDGER